MPAFTITFDAAGLVLGDMTRQTPGLKVRTVVVDIAARPILTVLEMNGPADAREAIIEGLRTRYAGEISDLESSPNFSRCKVGYQDTEQLRQNIVYRQVIDNADRLTAGVIYFEDGLAIICFETRGDTDPVEVAADIHFAVLQAGFQHVFIRDLPENEEISSWNQLPLQD